MYLGKPKLFKNNNKTSTTKRWKSFLNHSTISTLKRNQDKFTVEKFIHSVRGMIYVYVTCICIKRNM